MTAPTLILIGHREQAGRSRQSSARDHDGAYGGSYWRSQLKLKRAQHRLAHSKD
jgi:hypothetical protein